MKVAKRIIIKTIIIFQVLMFLALSPFAKIADFSNISYAANPTNAQSRVGNFISQYTMDFIAQANNPNQTSGGYSILNESHHPNFITTHNQMVFYSNSSDEEAGQLGRTTLRTLFVNGYETYPSGKVHSPAYNNYAEVVDGFAADCSSFVSLMYELTTGYSVYSTTGSYPTITGSYAVLECLGEYEPGKAFPGDIIIKRKITSNLSGSTTESGHAMIYLGQDLSKGEYGIRVGDCSTVTQTGLLQRSYSAKSYSIGGPSGGETVKYRVYRIKSDIAEQLVNPESDKYILDKSIADLNWPGDLDLGLDLEYWDDQYDPDSRPGTNYPFYYNGLPKKVSVTESESLLKKILEFLSHLIDWLLGLKFLGIKIEAVGWTGILETILSNIVEKIGQVSSTTEGRFNIEKIIYNKVPVLDVDFFDIGHAGGVELDPDGLLYKLRFNIASWYYIVWTVTAIGLLITLIYIGIRTIAEQKAQYQKMLVNWVVSVAMLFTIHIFMIAVQYVNKELVNLFASSADMNIIEESLFMDIVRIPASISVPATIIYLALTYYLVKFLIVYFKRLLDVAILTLMAPVIAIGYSIDMIKDNKSQSLSTWMKAYVMAVFLQLMHAIVFTIFMGMILQLLNAPSSLFGDDMLPNAEVITKIILMLVTLNFMFSAEKIFKKIFNKGKSADVGDVADATVKGLVGFTAAKKIGTWYGKNVIKPVGSKLLKPLNNLYNKAGIAALKNTKPYKDLYQQAASGKLPGMNTSTIDKMAAKEWKQMRTDTKNAFKIAGNTVVNTGASVMAIPMMVVNPGAGTALAIKAIKNRPHRTLRKLLGYRKDLNSYQNKQYSRQIDKQNRATIKQLKQTMDKKSLKAAKKTLRLQTADKLKEHAEQLKIDNKEKNRFALEYIASSSLTLGLTNNALDTIKGMKENDVATIGVAKKALHDISVSEAQIVTTLSEARENGITIDGDELKGKLQQVFERNTTKDAIHNLVKESMRGSGHMLNEDAVKDLMEKLGLKGDSPIDEAIKKSGGYTESNVTNYIYQSIQQNKNDRVGMKEMATVLEKAEVLRDANDMFKKATGKAAFDNVEQLIDSIIKL